MSSKPRISPGVDCPVKRQNFIHIQHKRHDRQPNEDMEDDDHKTLTGDDMNAERAVAPLKLTIRIGGQTLGEKSVNKSSIRALNTVSEVSPNEDLLDLSVSFDDEEEEEEEEDEEVDDADEDDDDVDLDEEIEEESADEDEQWLDALEEGRLHEVDDELKRIKDPKLMTARQRALLENKCLKEKTETAKSIVAAQEMSDEMVERKLVRDRRRRQQAEEKREKDRKDTIDRLLRKKQEMAQKARKKKGVETPRITYKNSQNGVYICLPHGMSFQQLWPARVVRRPPATDIHVKCARDGCEHEKKYITSKTQQPVCSLFCYKAINESID